MTTTHQTTNPMLQLAHDFVYFTKENVFLTGKAGTGKTTFLKQLQATCPKQYVVLAPTGVAAINAGGVTIHSFFQLPFAPFVPASLIGAHPASDKQDFLARMRLSKEKRDLIRSIDLLVIDEISMVRCDVLDAIDLVLRHIRGNNDAFGGVQMLFIGDMYQLPPVVPETDWEILRQYYDGPFFFNSKVMDVKSPVYIELQTIYRQSDGAFIDLLNQVRNNELTTLGLNLLNDRFQPGFQAPKEKHYITLTTHNRKADAINETALAQLPGQAFIYNATVEGDFNDKNFPAEQSLQLKVGAQVMFLKNDVLGKRYYNGKIGVITDLTDETIEVKCPGEASPIKVAQDTWRNVQYTLNRQLQQVEEKEIGSFTQFPLRLAWAVTIHKSQGLTFENAIIDAADSFSAGQVYVALSRCKSLEGLVLLSKVPSSAVKVDSRVQHFASGARPASALQQAFAESRCRYQQQLLYSAFDGNALFEATEVLKKVVQRYPEAYGEKVAPWIASLQQMCGELKETSVRFHRQLRELMEPAVAGQLEENAKLQARVQKASAWFAERLSNVLHAISIQPAMSDSEEQAAEYEAALAVVFTAATQWNKYLIACSEGFETTRLLRAKSKVSIEEIVGTAYAGSRKNRSRMEDSPHPVLLARLKQLRDTICDEEHKPIYMVASGKTLVELVTYLPQSREELLQITGFGTQKVTQFGDSFLAEIIAYCHEHGLESQMQAAKPKKLRKPQTEKAAKASGPDKLSTRDISYSMWRAGKSVEEIAHERKLQPSTIEGHLGFYVLSGEIPVQELVPEWLVEKISAVAFDLQTARLGAIKSVMGDEASFGQIRIVVHQLIRDGKLKVDDESLSSVDGH